MIDNSVKAVKKVSFPPLWCGYGLGLLLTASAIILGIVWPELFEEYLESDASPAEPFFALIWFIGIVYWLVCVHRIHKAIYSSTAGTYPISPSRAVWLHFVPFYNFYWIFKWTGEAVKFINVNSGSKPLSSKKPGVLLLVGMLLGSGFGLLFLFGALEAITRGIQKVIPAVSGVDAVKM